ncbi:MAG: XrtA system polysaccharide chain length determinant [Acetobacteraceae bacterium]
MDQVLDLLARTLRLAWRRRWAGLAVAWVVCLAGWAGVHEIPDRYQVSARLYVDADAVLTPLLRGVAADTHSTDQLSILQRTLLSRPNLQTLIAKTDLGLTANTGEAKELLITELGNDITVQSQDRNPNLFSISYANSNPRLARDVVQTLLSIFTESASGTNRSDMQSALRFLELQIASYEKQLHAMEERRADFRTKYAGILPADGTTGGTTETARDAVTRLELALQDGKARVAQLKARMSGLPPTLPGPEIPGYAGGGGGGGQLAQAQARLSELETLYTNDYPGVIEQRKLIEQLRRTPGAAGGGGGRAGSRGGAVPNPLYDQLAVKLLDDESNVASLTNQLQSARDILTRIEKIRHDQPALLAEYENLNRDYSVLRHNYDELLTRLQAARIAQAADTQADKVHLRVVDPPEIPLVPIWPNRPLFLTGVLFGGIIFGVGTAVLLSQFDRSFATLDELRALGLPVLGGLSAMGGPSLRRRAFAAGQFAVAIVLLIGLYGGLLVRMLRASNTV